MKHIVLAAALSLVATQYLGATTPSWFETDSAKAISKRLDRDFSLTVEQARHRLSELYGASVAARTEEFIAQGLLETRTTADGNVMVFRKAPSNLKLICPEVSGVEWISRGADADSSDVAIVRAVIESPLASEDEYYHRGPAQTITFRFVVDVPYNEVLDGDTLRVWMPVPVETERQYDISILSSSHPYVLSDGRSVHNTIYMQAPVTTGESTHFEYTGRYTVTSLYVSEEDILSRIQPYDTTAPFYTDYTTMQAPHIVDLGVEARDIIGDETNPYLQHKLVYKYIADRYPWAGAREYSTIPCMPRYVLDRGYGDCGQVSMLYISMMRSLGIPAQWESGWMLHPGDLNYHDWAEVYFEGIGWVPVDMSFGNYGVTPETYDKDTHGFYSHGIDMYRFASNRGICGTLYPAKKYIRSETVDFQAGEVETSRGNLFYPGWRSSLQIIKTEPTAVAQAEDE